MTQERLDSTQGPARELIEGIELDHAIARGTLVPDPRRARPLYFDGLFLTAEILTRDQNYFLTRQADLGQLTGGGVVDGLGVAIDEPGRTLSIEAGHGMTPGGEIVALREPLEVDVTAIAAHERLQLTFGIEKRPRQVARNRSGLFVLALRPVEYFANKLATSYPTRLDGRRKLELSDIVEATLVSLIPYRSENAGEQTGSARARAALDIFSRGAPARMPADALPLAMVAFERGMVSWLDVHLVRRLAATAGVLGFGLVHRSVREAFLHQYDAHLRDVLQSRRMAGQSETFPASEHFLVLPPAGPMPVGGLKVIGGDLSQVYFPPETEVDLSVVPFDELPRLLEDSLSGPPIDLTLDAEAQEEVRVLALIPTPRERIGELRTRLQSLRRKRLRHPVPGHLARVRPVDALARLRRLRVEAGALVPADFVLAEWQRLLAGTEELFYVRRRSLREAADVVARIIQAPVEPLPGDEPIPEPERLSAPVLLRVEDAGESGALETVLSGAQPGATLAVDALLGTPPFARPVLVSGALFELGARTAVTGRVPLDQPDLRRSGVPESLRPRLTGRRAPGTLAIPTLAERLGRRRVPASGVEGLARRRALRVSDVREVADRYQEAGLGTGWDALCSSAAELRELELRRTLASSGRVPELDALARSVSDEEFQNLARNLLVAAQAGDVVAIRRLADESPVPSPGSGDELANRVGILVGRAEEQNLLGVLVRGAEARALEMLNKLLTREEAALPIITSALLGDLFVLLVAPTPISEALMRRALLAQLGGDEDLPILRAHHLRALGERWRHSGRFAGLRNLEKAVAAPLDVRARRLIGLSGAAPQIDRRVPQLNRTERRELHQKLDNQAEAAHLHPQKALTTVRRLAEGR